MPAVTPIPPGRSPGLFDVAPVILSIIVGAFIAVAWYNSFELIALIFTYFKRYKSMVTGQSMVLYSRLHLLLVSDKLLRLVLWMIIIDAIILHIPTAVVGYGTLYHPGNNSRFTKAYEVIERVEMTGFCVQEFTISCIYIWQTVLLLYTSSSGRGRSTMWQLIAINGIIIVMDIALLVVEYTNYWLTQIALKGMVYSIKLKFEFAVLTKMVGIAMEHEERVPDFVGVGQISSDMSRVSPTQRSKRHNMWFRSGGGRQMELEHISPLSHSQPGSSHSVNGNGNGDENIG
ncbi:hypothetical protein AJ80_02506 [Polytolypa hystricis UAMH7299]|uniref:DUF7703 domain-containing protein n=1 Tax=Polytolypa hystricis (strain UAMH7299) TaxID=1447883 RepID=A0A2B7YP21_POLH7|nr:hypothetical protein AJ80_02506 [Polytolypa hystricis UAMH7299]